MCNNDNILYFGLYYAVFGHSIVVYGTGTKSNQILGCTKIEPSLVAEEELEISFPRNGTQPEDVDRCVYTSN